MIILTVIMFFCLAPPEEKLRTETYEATLKLSD